MKNNQQKTIHPLLQKIIDRLIQTGMGEVFVTPDGHIFFRPNLSMDAYYGAQDMKKEGKAAGVRIIIRKVTKRAKDSKYAQMPWFQLYTLPIVKKDAATMSDAERRNMELNAQAVRMAHAVEKDPEQAAIYHKLHEEHKRNQAGYKKLYPNFYGFLVATFRKELEAKEMCNADAPLEVAHTEHQSAADASETGKEKVTGIRLCVPTMVGRTACVARKQMFRPFIRLPMVA